MATNLKEIIAREDHIERRRWAFPIIDPSYRPDKGHNEFFESDDDLDQFTALEGSFYSELVVAELEAQRDTVGCRLYGRRRTDYPCDVTWFAYASGDGRHGYDDIYAGPPRIEVDKNGVRLISGNNSSLMHSRPLPTE